MIVSELIADKIKVSGPSIDGGWKVTFEVGEYMQEQVANLLKVPQQQSVKVMVYSGEKDEK